jgi:hypothetical protein
MAIAILLQASSEFMTVMTLQLLDAANAQSNLELTKSFKKIVIDNIDNIVNNAFLGVGNIDSLLCQEKINENYSRKSQGECIDNIVNNMSRLWLSLASLRTKE